MTQDAIVTKIVDRNKAEVEIKRGTACGGNCESCAGHGCSGTAVYQKKIRIVASNKVYAKVGDHVVISSETKSIMGALLFLYVLPLVAFLAGYMITAMLGASEGVSILSSMLCFFVTVAIIIFYTRRKKKEITFEIIDIKS